jgi:hypothetical protein
MVFNCKFIQKNDTIQEEHFKKLIENKRVVIVGPADYVDKHDIINHYDVIIRINKGTNMEKTKKCGSRTDILYHAVNMNKENGGPLPIRENLHIRFAYPPFGVKENSSFCGTGTWKDYKRVQKWYPTLKNFSIVPKSKYLNFEIQCDSRPNTGVVAILDILSYDIKELYITGFTLFQTNYCNSYRNRVDGIRNTGFQSLYRMAKFKIHNQQKTAVVFRDFILKHEKVKYDPELIDALEKTY